MMPEPEDFEDIHSHVHRGVRTLTSVEPDHDINTAYGEAWYSVGLHPWDLKADSDYDGLDRAATDPRVAAIGETGLDAHIGPDSTVQEEAFLHHVALSERLGKPLVVHCVGRYGRMIELRRSLKPTQRWIIHGFRGKPELARQLVDAGFDISLGERFNPGVLSVVPKAHLFAETDTSDVPIEKIRNSIFGNRE